MKKFDDFLREEWNKVTSVPFDKMIKEHLNYCYVAAEKYADQFKMVTEENKDWIADQIENIMVEHGPDGHTDGSGVIVSFICALIERKATEWAEDQELTRQAKLNIENRKSNLKIQDEQKCSCGKPSFSSILNRCEDCA
jgi:hypothetical protein